ncbi:class I SAM-dependent methyltransferase [Isobaculum melis]|uniref:Methyltransferase domain-containing protein n=1 Tax=Isobaculum melis TaxID=142588 RepID=A0A1H9UAB8_9LACT|nr:class I SAM-dependent methyltransferase [Isobaculum melis]SES06104.1 Methyltransferase domain-containing protein [Isobaculum melis]
MLIWIGSLLLLGTLLFYYLLQQSKKPSGRVGIFMMRLWNKVYMPLVKWSLTMTSSIKKGNKILDIGVGNGASSRYLSTLASEIQVTGIDISKQAITSAQKLQSEANIDYQIMDVQDLAFDNQSFDLITAFQTHFHWPNLTKSLQEIHRVLKKDGRVIFASETAKIQYFLPRHKQPTQFEKELKALNFHHFTVHQTAQWTCYIFTK